jgi:hypothetical protein
MFVVFLVPTAQAQGHCCFRGWSRDRGGGRRGSGDNKRGADWLRRLSLGIKLEEGGGRRRRMLDTQTSENECLTHTVYTRATSHTYSNTHTSINTGFNQSYAEKDEVIFRPCICIIKAVQSLLPPQQPIMRSCSVCSLQQRAYFTELR